MLVIGLIVNILILGTFKYAGFFAETLTCIGIPVPNPNISLPIGISFYTFQSISYLIDVYRNVAPVQKRYHDLLLYISMFPQLIAGPIVRYDLVAKEINSRRVTANDFVEGSFRFFIGLGKKVILANQLSEISTQFLGGSLNDLSTTGAWVGIAAFALQIFFDFSGYSDMAIGLGRCLGFHFSENFKHPYVSRSITEFWRRWHISLGSFFRDYVYIPLGGNRRHQALNILVVWFLTGMWHGASWNFIIWGFSMKALTSGDFTTKINQWFSDTEPYRDIFLSMSMGEKDLINMSLSDDDVTFHASNTAEEAEQPKEEKKPSAAELEKNERNVTRAQVNANAEENATIANKGIIVVGKGPKTRALMAFGGGPEGGTEYASVANLYKKTFPSINVYCMVIPTAIDFYCPEKVKKATTEELPTINNIYAHLDPNVKAVNVYTPLSEHANEDIFLRTDHHWAPRGAYYAAQKFAQVAGVPFKTLSEGYTQKVIHGFVGSMYGYSKDVAIKNNPEDFVFWEPNAVQYKTHYIIFDRNANFNITKETSVDAPFFVKFPDGSNGAYCTFMGSDARITHVNTSTKNGRRLLIIKDSFGNALPGYLFYSFEDIHVIDERYFNRNMKKYVADNNITDILFANNVFMAYSRSIGDRYTKFLNQ